MTKPIKKRKHVPQRTCVGCREVQGKREMIRIVRQDDGVYVDETGKMKGRGAYLHARRICWNRAVKGALAGALRIELTAEDYERLSDYLKQIPEETVV